MWSPLVSNPQLFASTLKDCVESSQGLWPACEAVDVMYDVYGSSVELAELLAATGAASTLQHLATNFSDRVRHSTAPVSKLTF